MAHAAAYTASISRAEAARTHTLVIGGTRGGGPAVVNRLAEKGHEVSVIGRSAGDLKPPIHGFAADAADSAALRSTLDEVVERVGPLTHLVLLQRYRGDGDAWQGELDVSMTASKVAIEHFRDHLDQADDHSVVIVSSSASRLVAGNQPVGYHAAKAALVQMGRYYAVTLGPSGVRVNCVSPGAVLKDEAREFYAENPDLEDLYRRITPLRRMGSPEDLATAVLFLCDQGSFITGQDIDVDGGLSLAWQGNLAVDLADD